MILIPLSAQTIKLTTISKMHVHWQIHVVQEERRNFVLLNFSLQATSKSDDESSASLYECMRLWLRMPPLLRFEFGEDAASFKWHFNELLFKWSSCNFLSRSFSSRFCLRNLARRFLNQTWNRYKNKNVINLIFSMKWKFLLFFCVEKNDIIVRKLEHKKQEYCLFDPLKNGIIIF